MITGTIKEVQVRLSFRRPGAQGKPWVAQVSPDEVDKAVNFYQGNGYQVLSQITLYWAQSLGRYVTVPED